MRTLGSLLLLLIMTTSQSWATLPANELWRENLLNFREGWAKFGNVTGPGSGVTGGAGGTLCTVSNLNDSGAGSLRSCIMTSGPQWIIFSVSGTIQLLSDLFPTLGHQGPGANKTIDGRGQVITISANAGGNGLMQACADNWIIHNIKMTTVPNGAFIFRNLASNGTWFDHVDLTGAGQTLVSAFFGTAGIGPPCTPNVDVATNVTVSWTKTHDICTPGSGQVWPDCGSGMYLVGGSGNDTGMTNFTGTFHHNWYTHTSGVRFPIVYYGRMHSYNNWMDNTDQGAQAIYHARHVWENNIFECHPDNGDHMQCGFSGNPHRVWCNFTNAQVTQPSDCCRVTGSWLVTGTETFTEQNAASCFSPAADYSYTLDIADAALKTKLQDSQTGAGVVPNPYNTMTTSTTGGIVLRVIR